jgi:hypothetical protein
VARVIVNQAHCFATGGSFDNALPFSLSMGCGTWGGNSISDNLGYRHFLNITRVVRPFAPSWSTSRPTTSCSALSREAWRLTASRACDVVDPAWTSPERSRGHRRLRRSRSAVPDCAEPGLEIDYATLRAQCAFRACWMRRTASRRRDGVVHAGERLAARRRCSSARCTAGTSYRRSTCSRRMRSSSYTLTHSETRLVFATAANRARARGDTRATGRRSNPRRRHRRLELPMTERAPRNASRRRSGDADVHVRYHGTPKGALLSHANMLSAGARSRVARARTRRSRAVVAAALHINGQCIATSRRS